MSSNVEKLLRTRLISNPVVSNLVSSKVYSVVAPQGSPQGDMPYVVYTRTSTEFINSSEGWSNAGSANVSIVSWASSYDAAKSLSDAVRHAINGWRDKGSDPEIDLASLVNESDVVLVPEEGKELPEAYGVALEVMISFEET